MVYQRMFDSPSFNYNISGVYAAFPLIERN